MNRMHRALAASYRRKAVSGNGTVTAEDCVHCCVPEVTAYGRAVQEPFRKNLFDMATSTVQRWYIANGVIAAGTNGRMVSLPCCPNVTYAVTKTAGTVFYVGYVTETPQVGTKISGIVVNNTADRIVITTGAEATHLALWFFNAASDTIPLEEMVASIGVYSVELCPAHPIYPVFAENNVIESVGVRTEHGAVAVPLLRATADGEYRDEWWMTTGKVVRRVAVIAFDGSENWAFYYNGFYVKNGLPGAGAQSTLKPGGAICSHCPYSTAGKLSWIADVSGSKATPRFLNSGCETVEDWVSFLAEQYAAGTPVTFVYPLAEPVAETVVPQKLVQRKGVTEIVQTEGSVSGLPMTVTFLTG